MCCTIYLLTFPIVTLMLNIYVLMTSYLDLMMARVPRRAQCTRIAYIISCVADIDGRLLVHSHFPHPVATDVIALSSASLAIILGTDINPIWSLFFSQNPSDLLQEMPTTTRTDEQTASYPAQGYVYHIRLYLLSLLVDSANTLPSMAGGWIQTRIHSQD